MKKKRQTFIREKERGTIKFFGTSLFFITSFSSTHHIRNKRKVLILFRINPFSTFFGIFLACSSFFTGWEVKRRSYRQIKIIIITLLLATRPFLDALANSAFPPRGKQLYKMMIISILFTIEVGELRFWLFTAGLFYKNHMNTKMQNTDLSFPFCSCIVFYCTNKMTLIQWNNKTVKNHKTKGRWNARELKRLLKTNNSNNIICKK